MTDAASALPQVLLLDRGRMPAHWPFTRERLEANLRGHATLTYIDTRTTSPADADWENAAAALTFGSDPTPAMIDRAAKLKVVAGVFDAYTPTCYESLQARDIPLIDATSAWGPSVAEIGLALTLCGLRRICHWHHRLATRTFDWTFPFTQFCDDPDFVNGDLGTKRVGVVGLGQIGGRMAKWASMMGAEVFAYDPFAGDARFAECGARQLSLEETVDQAEVFMQCLPPLPNAERLVNAALVKRLQRGTLVVTVTRTWGIDVDALRARVLADELAWATDVYDVEPLPDNDPLRGRANVVHLPHIAGRTRDANFRVADILAAGVFDAIAGREPKFRLQPQTAAMRPVRMIG